jgi:hypothetical protein
MSATLKSAHAIQSRRAQQSRPFHLSLDRPTNTISLIPI